ncbi:MAG: trigger factor [Planctomycetes bacterium]|nr:trigger factor [Planctomycetota bacterium]MCB9871972.1 trigger factor [Planctomycetota bacterium]MCB9889529.1 trigger factor [Planctomycetota bacterium]
MEVQVVESGPCRRSVTITVPPDKIRHHVDEVYKSAAEQVRIKGFRAGKVPRKVLEKRFGPELLAEAKEHLINKCFEEAMKANDLTFIGEPKLEGSDKPLEPDAAFEFQVHLDVRPNIELQRVKGIEAKSMPTAVTDEDVTSGLQQLAEQKRTLKPVDEPVEDGDFVKGELRFKQDGVVVHERKGAQLNTGIPVAGTDPEVFKAKLRGSEKGSKLSLEIKFPDNFDKTELRGQKGELEIEVREVMRVVAPPIDDALAKQFEFESLDALKQKLTERIGEEKVARNQSIIEGTVIDTLLRENPFPVPESMVEGQKKHMLRQAAEQMKENGADEQTIAAELAKHDAEAAKEAESKVRVFFLLDTIARREKIFVTEGDLDVELRNIAAANGVSAEQVRSYYQEHDMISDLRLAIMERKVREFLRNSAKITDTA